VGIDVGQTESFQDRTIREYVAGLSFVDIGGLWGTLNEKVTVASLRGARSAAMADMQPHTSNLWQTFRDRCAALGVTGYSEYCVNLDDPHLGEKLGSYDFVHSSGILYHVPSPLFSVAQLRIVTNKYLLIGSMVLPEQVTNEVGSLDFSGGVMLLVPAIDPRRRSILARHFDGSGIKIVHINSDQTNPFRIGGKPSYSPWWWLYSATTLRAMLEVSGFSVLAQESYWDERVSYCFCEKTKD
jgi:hypothetical protein